MPAKSDNKPNPSVKMTSQQLTQKAAGYLLAAANASKTETKTKKSK